MSLPSALPGPRGETAIAMEEVNETAQHQGLRYGAQTRGLWEAGFGEGGFSFDLGHFLCDITLCSQQGMSNKMLLGFIKKLFTETNCDLSHQIVNSPRWTW